MATHAVTSQDFNQVVESNDLVFVDFWATWCGPCCREIPYLKEAYAAFSGRGFSIYAVSIDHDAARWQRFLAENDLPWTNVLSPGCGKQSPAAAAKVQAVPTLMVVKKQQIIFQQAGALRASDLDDLISQAKALDMDAAASDGNTASSGDAKVKTPSSQSER